MASKKTATKEVAQQEVQEVNTIYEAPEQEEIESCPEPTKNQVVDLEPQKEVTPLTFEQKALRLDNLEGYSRFCNDNLVSVIGAVKERHDQRNRESITDAKFNQIVAQAQKLNSLIVSFLNSK